MSLRLLFLIKLPALFALHLRQVQFFCHLDSIVSVIPPFPAHGAWPIILRRLYGPQEEEMPEDSADPRAYARFVKSENIAVNLFDTYCPPRHHE